jgi:uncharacterized protein YyaL (SSP411 family)
LKTAEGRLLHRYREEEASVDGNLDDYAFLIWGLIELYEATFKTKYLDEALRLQDDMLEYFWDKDREGFFFQADNSEKVLTRFKEFHDGAIPSGNSVACLNLLRLSRMTGRAYYEKKALALAKAHSTHEENTIFYNTMFLTALDFLIGPTYEIVVVGRSNSKETRSMIRAIKAKFIPNKVILFKEENQEKLGNFADFVKGMRMLGNKTRVYVCSGFVCNSPATEIEDVLNLLT